MKIKCTACTAGLPGRQLPRCLSLHTQFPRHSSRPSLFYYPIATIVAFELVPGLKACFHPDPPRLGLPGGYMVPSLS